MVVLKNDEVDLNLDDRVEDLEVDFRNLRRRIEPGMKLYESLIPYGIDRFMLPLLKAFAKEYEAAQNGKSKASIWNLKWARWAAIAGIVFIIVQIVMLGLVVYNTVFGVHNI